MSRKITMKRKHREGPDKTACALLQDLFGLPTPIATWKIMFAPWVGVAEDVWNPQANLRVSACLTAAFNFL